MYIKLVCVATDKNSFLEDWKESASAWGYDFDVIGIGHVWNGFQTKLDLVCEYLANVDRDCVVAIADSYDLLLSGPPSEMLDKYMKLSGNGSCLVVGGESTCFLNGHKHSQFVNNPVYKYVNGGFVIGRPAHIEEAYEYIIIKTPYDAQLGMGMYFDEFPSRVVVDGNQELVANTRSTEEIYLIADGRVRHSITGSKPVALHFPFLYQDLGRRSEKFRSHIIYDYKRASRLFYVKGFIKHIIKHGYHNPVYKPIIAGVLILGVILGIIGRRLKHAATQKQKIMSDSQPQLHVAVEKPSNGLFSHFSVYHMSAELLALAVVFFYIRFNNTKLQNKINRLSTRLNDQEKEIEELKKSIASLLAHDDDEEEEEEEEEEAYDDVQIEEVEISPNQFSRQIFINDPPKVHTSKVRKPVIIQHKLAHPKIIHHKRVERPRVVQRSKTLQRSKTVRKPKTVQKPKTAQKPKTVQKEAVVEPDVTEEIEEIDLDEILQEELSELSEID